MKAAEVGPGCLLVSDADTSFFQPLQRFLFDGDIVA